MFNAITNGISITVMPVYIDERSDPEGGQHFWAYRVIIENNSPETIQLLSRYWKIIDGEGHVEEVEGEGVVGLQPVIKPGTDFTYTSGCPLNSTSGIMQGHYVICLPDNSLQKVEIPACPLDLPGIDPIIN
jgi:ApaG protein